MVIMFSLITTIDTFKLSSFWNLSSITSILNSRLGEYNLWILFSISLINFSVLLLIFVCLPMAFGLLFSFFAFVIFFRSSMSFFACVDFVDYSLAPWSFSILYYIGICTIFASGLQAARPITTFVKFTFIFPFLAPTTLFHNSLQNKTLLAQTADLLSRKRAMLGDVFNSYYSSYSFCVTNLLYHKI